MSRLDTILNPQDNDVPTLRANRVPSPRSSPSSPTSSVGESSRTLKVSRNFQRSKDHCAHPSCPDTLRCLPDTDGRPQHTLPVILRCAILGSKMKRLTIREIYAAMEEKYPYYRTAGSTWKQSVRHHLSLNRLFERQPRPVTDPCFGSYWTVNLEAPPGTKRPRKRGRPQREVNGDPPVKKRGRPRKEPETEKRPQTEVPRKAPLLVPSAHHMSSLLTVSTASASNRHQLEDEDEEGTPRSDYGVPWGMEDEFESEEDGDKLPRRPITPAYDRAADFTVSESPAQGAPLLLQDDHSMRDAFPENIIDHLKVQMGMLRRQASEARSEVARMTQQLSESKADVSRQKCPEGSRGDPGCRGSEEERG